MSSIIFGSLVAVCGGVRVVMDNFYYFIIVCVRAHVCACVCVGEEVGVKLW